MTRRFQILLLTLLTIQCQTRQSSLDGHYVSTDKFNHKRYLTLDIVDSQAIVNRVLIFKNQRDTLVIDKEKNALRATLNPESPFFEFKQRHDTVFLRFSHDGGDEEIGFVKAEFSVADYFSNSLLEIDLKQLTTEERVDLNGMNVKHMTIGPMKNGIGWSGHSDSIYVEFENETLLSLTDLETLEKKLNEDTVAWTLSVTIDNETPDRIVEQTKDRLLKSIDQLRLVETRLNGNELVFVK